MEMTTSIRAIAGVLALIVVAIIVYRRNKNVA